MSKPQQLISKIRTGIGIHGVVDTEKCYVRKAGIIFIDLHMSNGEISVFEGHEIAMGRGLLKFRRWDNICPCMWNGAERSERRTANSDQARN